MDGTGLLGLVTDTDEELHLIPRSKVTGVTAPCEGVHVEEYTPRAPIVLVANEPVLQKGIKLGMKTNAGAVHITNIQITID